MKKTLRMKFMLLLCALVVGIGNALADNNVSTVSTAFSATGTVTTNFSQSGNYTKAVWSLSVTWSSIAYWGALDSTKGSQVGSGAKPATSIELTGSTIPGTITSVAVNTSGASSINATVAIAVGGSTFQCNKQNTASLTSSAATYTFTGSGTGDVVLTWSNSSSKAIYIKSVTVTYTEGSTYTVTYDAGDGSGTVPTDGTKYSEGASVTVKDRGGVTHETLGFRGWFDGTNTYEPGETFTMGDANVTLTAVWRTKCTFSYNGNGNTGGAIPSSGFYSDYGAGATITVLGNSGNLVKTGSAWDGWTDGSNDYVEGNQFTISSNTILSAKWRELATYTLITDVSQIEPGKHYIIASSKTAGAATAMGAQGSTGNNRVAVDVTVSSVSEKTTKTKITEADGLKEFVISGPETVIKNNKTYYYYTIFDESINKYLYAAGNGSGKNYLKNQEGIDGNSQWTITFSSDAAVIKAQGTNGNNIIRKNSSSAIFSCYSSGQNAIYLYKKDTDPTTTYYSQTELSVADLDSESTPTTVLKNEVLTLTGTVTCNNAANLVVKEGGQLIIPAAKSDPVKATFQREIEGYTNTKDNYYLIASPVVNDITLTEGSGMLTANYDLYYFTNTTPGVEWRNNKVEHFNKLENSKGYLYANSSDKIIEFPGTVPTATTAGITLNYNSSNTKYAGFNLVGNPLSVNITSMYLNSSACGYYYLSSTGVFTAVTAANVSSNPVIVGQAFMVQASDADHCSLTLNASSVSKGEDVYNDEVIRLEVSNNKYTDVAYLCFGNSMPLTKINHINNEAPMLYIHTESDDQAVAVMNERAEVKTVNVNFEAKTMGMYTISGKAERGNFIYMHLYDRLTGIDTDLLESDYTFIGSTNDAAGRFILHFEAIDYNADNESFAYQNGSDIIVNGEGELQIFDVTGRFVMSERINDAKSINADALSKGVYILRIVGSEIKTQKIIIK